MNKQQQNKWQADRRNKMREAGFVLTQLWVHKNDQQKLKDFAEKLQKNRNLP